MRIVSVIRLPRVLNTTAFVTNVGLALNSVAKIIVTTAVGIDAITINTCCDKPVNPKGMVNK